MDGGFLFTVILLAAVMFYLGYREFKKSKKGKNMENKTNDENREWAERQLEKTSEAAGEMEDISTRDLLIQTLREMNCNVEEGRDSDVIFNFEGGQFVARTNDGYNYVTLNYLFFYDVPLYDKARVEKLKRVVNETNIRRSVQTFYVVDREGGQVNVHCSSTFYFRPELKDRRQCLLAEIRDIFYTQHFLYGEMAKEGEYEEDE